MVQWTTHDTRCRVDISVFLLYSRLGMAERHVWGPDDLGVWISLDTPCADTHLKVLSTLRRRRRSERGPMYSILAAVGQQYKSQVLS